MIHDDLGRRVVIKELDMLGKMQTVADIRCDTTDESDWFQHFGKSPRRVFLESTVYDQSPEGVLV